MCEIMEQYMAESREEGRKEERELFIKYLMSQDPSLSYEDAKKMVEALHKTLLAQA